MSEIDYRAVGEQLAQGFAHNDHSVVDVEGRGTVFAIRGDYGEFLIGSTWALASWNDLEKYLDFHRSGDPDMTAISTGFCLAMDWETEKPHPA